ncbi:MAG: IS1380 family transposase [Elusimicrobia bacterium]|nr:IS1380 family transposase [Elusimicrobiota bacterium]
MIRQKPGSFKVEKSESSLTSFAGIPIIADLAHSCGLIKQLNAISGLWKRKRDYSTADPIMSLALTLIAGGERLDDTRLLKNDAIVSALNLVSIPSANTTGAFLKRFSHRTLAALARAALVPAAFALRRLKTAIIDIDSSLIESNKENAAFTYKKFSGYNPMLAWCPEADIFLACLFRNGNTSAQAHILETLKYCRDKFNKATHLRLRCDSAAYQFKIMEYCVAQGIDFTITADLAGSVRSAIASIPQDGWRPMIKDGKTILLAETVYTPGATNRLVNLPAFRLVVTRKSSCHPELFKYLFVDRAIISNFPQTCSTEDVLTHHNARGNAEKAIEELKNGFALAKLPCAELSANAAYAQICVLAYNLVSMFKKAALPADWLSYRIKNLRFRLLCGAALVVKHARHTIIKLHKNITFLEVFERARWAVLSQELSGG